MKPDFFRHESLQDLERNHPSQYAMLTFAGLWGHCDKGGVFEWRPRTLKLDILPFLEFDMAQTLELLKDAGFIRKYTEDGKDYGYISSFEEHQRISGKESQDPVKHPRPPEKQEGSNGEATGKQLGMQEGKGREGNKEGNRNGDARDAEAFDTDWLEANWPRTANNRNSTAAIHNAQALVSMGLATWGALRANVLAHRAYAEARGDPTKVPGLAKYFRHDDPERYWERDWPMTIYKPEPVRTWTPPDDDPEYTHAQARLR